MQFILCCKFQRNRCSKSNKEVWCQKQLAVHHSPSDLGEEQLWTMAEATPPEAAAPAAPAAAEAEEQVVNPWEVKTGSNQGIDYDKLISE